MATATPRASRSSVEDLEVDLLLEAVYRIRGFDFRDYARTSLRRRIQNRLRAEKIDTITRLLPPRTLLVGCQVADTGDGMGLTPPIAAAVERAVDAVRHLVARTLRPTEVA